MNEPYVGEIVKVGAEPAIVTKVHSSTVINVVVFHDSPAGAGWSSSQVYGVHWAWMDPSRSPPEEPVPGTR